MSVSELYARMTNDEINHWKAFHRIMKDNGKAPSTLDQRAARLAASMERK